nr:DUF6434 domain-containing protein [uncultured Pseudomonas sp.]
MTFNWHSDKITRNTTVCASYKNTQNVRRFMLEQCGPGFRFDRSFMAWIGNDTPKNMGEVVVEWKARQRA